jgi:hypothetical protein
VMQNTLAQRAILKRLEMKFESLVYALWTWFPWRRMLRHRNAFVSHSSPFVWGGRDVVAQLHGYWPKHLTIKIESQETSATLCRPLLFCSRVWLAWRCFCSVPCIGPQSRLMLPSY